MARSVIPSRRILRSSSVARIRAPSAFPSARAPAPALRVSVPSRSKRRARMRALPTTPGRAAWVDHRAPSVAVQSRNAPLLLRSLAAGGEGSGRASAPPGATHRGRWARLLDEARADASHPRVPRRAASEALDRLHAAAAPCSELKAFEASLEGGGAFPDARRAHVL